MIPSANSMRKLSYRSITIIIGNILLAAGILKGMDLDQFALQIRQYGLLPENEGVISGVAWFMVVVELGLGMALLVNWRPKMTLSGVIGLFSLFVIALAWAMLNGGVDDCGCFGPAVRRNPSEAMIEDLLILASAVAAWFLKERTADFRYSLKVWCVAAACIAGILLPMVMTALYTDAGGEFPSQKKGEHSILLHSKAGEKLDLGSGTSLLILMSTDCQHCRETVPLLNEVVVDVEESIHVFGVTSSEQTEIDQFVEETFAFYPVFSINETDLFALLGDDSFPKYLLVKEGKLLAQWRGEVPQTRELMNLANNGKGA
jgi:thiol-disulfide isomerase/thioredoxin